MSPGVHQFLSLDLPAMLTGTLAAVLCGLLGNFLVLRRQSLLGDAIAHAVLPGLVMGFLLTGSRATLPMFLGAAAAGVLAAVLIEVVRRAARLEAGAAMAVVFATMFALGVVLIERAAARGVDLDPDCVLAGQLERVFWFPPSDWGRLLTWGTLLDLPRELVTLAGATALAAGLVAAFFKELRLACFDPGLATALGFRAPLIHLGLAVAVAVAVVASFEAVGSILVVAMLVCPAAAARLLTDRLSSQVWVSVTLAGAAGTLGYLAATRLPGALGLGASLSAAGMIAVLAGMILLGAILLAPRHGVVARRWRTRRLAGEVVREDLLAALFRAEEARMHPHFPADPAAVRRAVRAGEVVVEGSPTATPRLTDLGRERARGLVRAHRLWESYLVSRAGLRPDHAHDPATVLEHVTDPALARDIEQATPASGSDPHGRPIPPA